MGVSTRAAVYLLLAYVPDFEQVTEFLQTWFPHQCPEVIDMKTLDKLQNMVQEQLLLLPKSYPGLDMTLSHIKGNSGSWLGKEKSQS
jgi:hypothetical protein